MTAPGTVPTAQTRSGLGSGLRPSAAWSLNPLGSINSPPIKSALPATPPSHLRAREIPDLATRKRPLPTPHPRRARLRALTACGGRRFPGRFGRSRSTMLKGRRVLRSTAPREQPKTPENSLNSEFSTLWTNSFHCVEKRRKVFPLCGKFGLFFPQCGNLFSIVWKNPQNIFHCVENFWGHAARKVRGKALGLFFRQ